MIEKTQSRIELLNEFLEYKESNYKDDSILDAIQEFALKKDLDAEILAREFADDNAFKVLVENDLKKFKFVKVRDEQNLNVWE